VDLFENHWGNEEDSVFLLRLYYVCFEASNFPLCKKLIEKVIEIDRGIGDSQMLIRDYKNYSELWLRLDKVSNAIDNLKIAQEHMEKMDPGHRLKREWAYLWHQYGNIYYHEGEANTALDYYMAMISPILLQMAMMNTVRKQKHVMKKSLLLGKSILRKTVMI